VEGPRFGSATPTPIDYISRPAHRSSKKAAGGPRAGWLRERHAWCNHGGRSRFQGFGDRVGGTGMAIPAGIHRVDAQILPASAAPGKRPRAFFKEVPEGVMLAIRLIRA